MNTCITRAGLVSLLLAACGPPPDVTDFSAVAAADTTVILKWSPVPTGASYSLSRREVSGTYGSIGYVASTTFTDTLVKPGQTYIYQVRAVKGGIFSVGVEATVTTPGTSLPNEPTDSGVR
jgi:fibronectin type 3 domain-containing protein